MTYIREGHQAYTKTILSLFLGSFVTFAIMYSVQPLIPTFSQEFGVSAATASLSLSVTTGTLAIAMLFTSTLSESVGRKPIMCASLVLSALLAVVSAFSPNFIFLLVVRSLLGVTLAGFPSIAMTYLNEEFDPKSLGKVMGIYVSGTTLGGLSSRVIVAALTDWFSWSIALGILAVICLLVSLWFWRNLPNSRRFSPQSGTVKKLASAFKHNIKEPGLLCLYTLAFLLMGSFVSLYNYIGYPLTAPPYNLSQTVVGFIFLIYLVGTFSSAFMGRMADRTGQSKVLISSILIMFGGGLITLSDHLVIKLFGVALFTFGFFGSHSIASGWVVKRATKYKSQASSFYLLYYYAGSSLIGTGGGVFWSSFGWSGLILMIGGLLTLSLGVATVLPILKKRPTQRRATWHHQKAQQQHWH